MTTLNRLRRITLINSETMELRNVTDTDIIKSLVAPQKYYLVLIHDLISAEANEEHIRNIFRYQYQGLKDADMANLQYIFLRSDKTYDLYFNNTTSKPIPRSTGHTDWYQGDLIIYCPTYEIIDDWE